MLRFARFVEQGIDMLLIANDPFFQSRRDQIVALTADQIQFGNQPQGGQSAWSHDTG